MVLNKRVTREQIAATFDSYDVFRRGTLKAKECVAIATVYFHFLDCNPQNLYIEFSAAPVVSREECINIIFRHITGATSSSEAISLYKAFTSDAQFGPMDSVDVVGSRFGENAVSMSHPDGYRLDSLLVSIACRVTNERVNSARVADSVLFVQNAASVLFPGRTPQEALHEEEWETLFVASALLSPGANKRLWKSLFEYAHERTNSPERIQEAHENAMAQQQDANAASAAAAGGVEGRTN